MLHRPLVSCDSLLRTLQYTAKLPIRAYCRSIGIWLEEKSSLAEEGDTQNRRDNFPNSESSAFCVIHHLSIPEISTLRVTTFFFVRQTVRFYYRRVAPSRIEHFISVWDPPMMAD